MLRKLQNKREQGFTIIEVLIVLAIAGLIMLVVFLAVPALQRNSRNTQRKNDVSALLGAIAEFNSNNNGKNPTVASEITANAKLSFFDPGQVSVQCFQALSAAVASTACTANTADPDPNNNQVIVVYGAKCGTGVGTVTATGASGRNVAAVYEVEGSAASTETCIES